MAEGRLNTKARTTASRSKAGRGLVPVPVWLLVTQVKLPNRLDLVRNVMRHARQRAGNDLGKLGGENTDLTFNSGQSHWLGF